ncbi:Mn-dependent transcriptional regulator [Geoglobus ahangari]|uniref:Mn-dependent transcriptional regulator n=1 Tax=Geoglobus ahangari TaxID=113653 RepID=A0A0F7DC71_9EURY|nr:metal-dependent transcriptional regulator [Geoglobus ahangari]AKG92331.1 Mn-dependent transcriptional regulator [Geoglobus ahangari]
MRKNGEELENLLKEIYVRTVENEESFEIEDSRLREELRRLGYIDDHGRLTEMGLERAKKIIRLHRLAERLLHDVLRASEHEVESSACRFEHVISEEVEEAICTLLGHPTVCPHGREIPRGECCIRGEEEVKSLVVRLTSLSPGEEGEIKYLSGDEDIIKKIISIGLLPGKRIRVLRVFPTFLVQVGNTQIALDEKIGEAIHVMRV